MTLPRLRSCCFWRKFRMEIKKSGAIAREQSNSMSAASTDTIEIELYDDLVAFSQMSSDERQVKAERYSGASELSSPAQPESEITYTNPSGGDISASELREAIAETARDSTLDLSAITSEQTASAAEKSYPIGESAISPLDESLFEPQQPGKHNGNGSGPVMKQENCANVPATYNRESAPLEDIWSGTVIKTGPLTTCPACGKPQVGDLFCIACGEFLQAGDEKIATVCRECASIVGNEDMFCPACGAVLSND